MRFTSRNVRRSISGALVALVALVALFAVAALAGCAAPEHGAAGQWQLSWRGRIGTEQAMVALQSHGEALSGSFNGAHGSLPLSGSLHGTGISFTVDFPGPPAYRILFSGVVRTDRIEGNAQPQGVDGRAFAGHGGEVAPDYYSWSATRITR
jgi:hypothetical protein